MPKLGIEWNGMEWRCLLWRVEERGYNRGLGDLLYDLIYCGMDCQSSCSLRAFWVCHGLVQLLKKLSVHLQHRFTTELGVRLCLHFQGCWNLPLLQKKAATSSTYILGREGAEVDVRTASYQQIGNTCSTYQFMQHSSHCRRVLMV